MTSEFPKTRYHVAPDAVLMHYLNQYLLPDRVFDAIMTWLHWGGGWVLYLKYADLVGL